MNVFELTGSIDFDVSGFKGKMEQVKTSVNEAKGEFEELREKGKNMQKTGAIMTAAVSVPLGMIARDAVNVGVNFEQGMNKVSAISGATGEDLEKLKDIAKEMGSTTKFSATEASEGLNYMALAGWKVDEMVAGLKPSLDLANAAGMELGRATDIVTDTLSMFGKEAEDAKEMTDMLAYAQANSNTDVGMLGEALVNAGSNAHAMGYDLADTAAILGTFADQGLKGGRAGTSLSAIFRDMKASAEGGAIAIGDTDVAIQDASGNYRGIVDIIADIKGATDSMSDAQRDAALATTFGDQAIVGMNMALEAGPEKIGKFEEGIRNSEGAAGDMAETMSQGLPGALESMRSSLEGAKIALAEAFAPIIKVGAKVVTFLADAFSAMPGWVQTAVAGLMAILIVLGPLITFLGTAIVGFTTFAPIVAAAAVPMLAFAGKAILVIGAIKLVVNIIKVVINWIKELGITWESVGDLIVSVGEMTKTMIEAPIRAVYGLFKWLVESVLGLFDFEFEFPSLLDAAKNAWQGVKDFFSWSLDGIKSLFSFDWLTGNTPSSQGRGRNADRDSVSWNAKGGVFNRPTIFDTANAGLQGVGEAGAEAIIPLDSNVLARIGAGIEASSQLNNNNNDSKVEALLIGLTKEVESFKGVLGKMKIEMDGREVGKTITPYVDDNLGKDRHFKRNRF